MRLSSALVIVLLEIFINYRNYAKFLKFLTLSLLAYPITALIVHEPWRQILVATAIPHIEFSFAFLIYSCRRVWYYYYAVSIFLAGVRRS